MLKEIAIKRFSDEEIEQTKTLVKELKSMEEEQSRLKDEEKHNFKIKKNKLRGELEAITGKIIYPLLDEEMEDRKGLITKLAGKYKGPITEAWLETIEMKSDWETYRWEVTTINGKRVYYDPKLDEVDRKYYPVRTIKQEMYKTLFLIQTNRKQYFEADELLLDFRQKCLGEFRGSSLDIILAEYDRVRDILSKIDWELMHEEKVDSQQIEMMTWLKNRPIDNLNKGWR